MSVTGTATFQLLLPAHAAAGGRPEADAAVGCTASSASVRGQSNAAAVCATGRFPGRTRARGAFDAAGGA